MKIKRIVLPFVLFFTLLSTVFAAGKPVTDDFLVDTIRQKGITDARVLDAILHIPRHFFMDSAFAKIAYEDRAFPIDEGQTISQPYTVAYQTQLLEIR